MQNGTDTVEPQTATSTIDPTLRLFLVPAEQWQMLPGSAECAAGALVYLSSVFCLLALAFSANSIRRRIASKREGLSFCGLAQLFNFGPERGGSPQYGVRPSRSNRNVSSNWLRPNGREVHRLLFFFFANRSPMPVVSSASMNSMALTA